MAGLKQRKIIDFVFANNAGDQVVFPALEDDATYDVSEALLHERVVEREFPLPKDGCGALEFHSPDQSFHVSAAKTEELAIFVAAHSDYSHFFVNHTKRAYPRDADPLKKKAPCIKRAAKASGRYFRGHTVFFHLVSALLIVWAFSLAAVVLWGLMISLTNGKEYELNPTQLFPSHFEWGNYWTAITTIEYNDTNYLQMIWNSVWLSFGITFCKLLATTLFAYVMARYQFHGRKILFAFVILMMMLPSYGSTSANYKYLFSLGMIDSPLFLLSQFAGHGANFLIMYSYFINISHAYDEAARVDGANDFQILGRIMIPIARPAILSVGIITFISSWNDYSTMLIFMDKYPILSSGLYRYKMVATYSLNTAVYFAGLFLAALPVAILFIAFNKMLMENLTIGGIKG